MTDYMDRITVPNSVATNDQSEDLTPLHLAGCNFFIKLFKYAPIKL